MNGEEVTSSRSLGRHVRALEEGETADLELWRDGKLETVSAAVAQRPRHVFKIGDGGVFRFETGENGGDYEVVIPEVAGQALEKVREYLDSDDFQMHIESLEDLDFEALQERMKQVERQLREIEVRIHEIEPEEEGS